MTTFKYLECGSVAFFSGLWRSSSRVRGYRTECRERAERIQRTQLLKLDSVVLLLLLSSIS